MQTFDSSMAVLTILCAVSPTYNPNPIEESVLFDPNRGGGLKYYTIQPRQGTMHERGSTRIGTESSSSPPLPSTHIRQALQGTRMPTPSTGRLGTELLLYLSNRPIHILKDPDPRPSQGSYMPPLYS
jgi:hypothetical protein